jgi:hypothetical protein
VLLLLFNLLLLCLSPDRLRCNRTLVVMLFISLVGCVLTVFSSCFIGLTCGGFRFASGRHLIIRSHRQAALRQNTRIVKTLGSQWVFFF